MAEKILVVRFSSLGDVVLTTPVYRNLKRLIPGCVTAAAVKEQYAGVLEGNPSVDRIIPLKQGESIFAYARRVRAERFDVIVDLHQNLRSRILTLLAGVPKVVRYRKAFWARRLFVRSRVRKPELERPTVQRYLDALRNLGLEPRREAPEIFPGSGKSRNDPPLRLLVVQTAFLGDAVLTTPLFSALRGAFPKARLSVLCTPEIRDVFSGNPHIDEILSMDKRGADRGLGALWSWARRLRGRYDIALVPHRSFRSALLVWLSGIPKRIGFRNSQGKFFLTETVEFDWNDHDSKRNLRLLEALGLPRSEPRVEVALQDAQVDFPAFLKAQGIPPGTPLLGMNPGSVWRTKRWLPERFARVADELTRERGCRVVLFGSRKDAEAVDAVAAHMREPVVNLCGKTDLKSLAYLISRCSLFVTNDSGPMHLANAAGVPLVAIFGPTTRELGFFPTGEKSAVVELDLSCRPCSLHGGERCPLDHFKCMREVTPEMVLAACRRLLERYPPGHSGA